MNRAELLAYLLAKPDTTAEYPFGPGAQVFKVRGKMFAIVGDDEPLQVSLKADPSEVPLLREKYTAVQPGYHLNKKHWNTVTLDGSIPTAELHYMIDMSFRLVVRQNLNKTDREQVLSQLHDSIT
jgi:predicted DNA-binding protein (MmcQ/YjbR family)